ncbi:dihydropteroate synthase [Citrobacter portucalensis]|uniref:dihydropteroate synthase n=1 Tax=Citrobacter portucalensis TaxID=1639133 RepID=UPI00226BBBD9|nr:dihydropteroate synthase [Citrobacter portucalensis]MCX8986075.1 dihydropteroate synthase [Citrobacter portucalensis]
MKLQARNSTLDLSVPQVMGILNITPDSFSDGGCYNTFNAAISHTEKMIKDGATIIDIGGESSRPGAGIVSVEEELHRVIPIVEAVAKRFDVWISVDTSRPEVIREASAAGMHLINDIRALSVPGAPEAAAETGLPVCLMHMQGQPANMQKGPVYDDVVAEVSLFFSQRIQSCLNGGIKRENIILDPGLGFGKTLSHNYQLLHCLDYFKRYELPLLVGMSRKSMIGLLLNNADTAHRLNGTIASSVIAAMKGAHIIRVHDVKETYEALQILRATVEHCNNIS